MTEVEIMYLIVGLSLGHIIWNLIDSIFNVDYFFRYRQGQIDALNGKVKYEKKENKDGEIKWVKIEELNKKK